MLKVKSEKLLIIAAVVWLLAGINILRLGVIAITETELVAALLAVGVVVTFLLFHMMFAKLVGKQSNRIRAYGNEPTCAFAFFDVKGYIMMAIMMGGGIALREFGIIPALGRRSRLRASGSSSITSSGASRSRALSRRRRALPSAARDHFESLPLNFKISTN